jgi:predicted GIY-YIG superfamily endonuclease
MTRPGAVYRHYNAAGDLLYIGSSYDPAKRIGGHRCDPRSWWSREIDTIKVQWFDTIREARNAEKRAIEAEQPPYNKLHNPGNAGPREKQIAGPLLAAWLSERGETAASFAKRTGVFPTSLRRIIACEVCPNAITKRRIQEGTSGEIPADVWGRGGEIPWYVRGAVRERAEALLAPVLAHADPRP